MGKTYVARHRNKKKKKGKGKRKEPLYDGPIISSSVSAPNSGPDPGPDPGPSLSPYYCTHAPKVIVNSITSSIGGQETIIYDRTDPVYGTS